MGLPVAELSSRIAKAAQLSAEEVGHSPGPLERRAFSPREDRDASSCRVPARGDSMKWLPRCRGFPCRTPNDGSRRPVPPNPPTDKSLPPLAPDWYGPSAISDQPDSGRPEAAESHRPGSRESAAGAGGDRRSVPPPGETLSEGAAGHVRRKGHGRNLPSRQHGAIVGPSRAASSPIRAACRHSTGPPPLTEWSQRPTVLP